MRFFAVTQKVTVGTLEGLGSRPLPDIADDPGWGSRTTAGYVQTGHRDAPDAAGILLRFRMTAEAARRYPVCQAPSALTTPLLQESIQDGADPTKLRGATRSDCDGLPLIGKYLYLHIGARRRAVRA